MRIIYKVPGQHASQLRVPDVGTLRLLLDDYFTETVIDSETKMLTCGDIENVNHPFNVEAWGIPVRGPLIVCGYGSEGEYTDCPISVKEFERIGCGAPVMG